MNGAELKKNEQKMKKSGIILSVTAILLAVITLGIVIFNQNRPVKYVYENGQAGMHQVTLEPSTWPDFTYAAEHAIKAVVHVKVLKKGQETAYSLFDFFFGDRTPQTPRNQVGSGSGVIISEDGYIVTNNHVIEGASEVNVTLENNRSFTAKVIGNDPVTDVALIKIEANDLPFLKFGDSDALRLGQWVLAIGNPYNLTSTITAGIVSAKGRSGLSYPDENGFKIESFIQTDAAVNPGNSGGALVTVSGDLVGINTAIASRTGSFAGYSFAVPSSIAKKVVEDIKQFGTVQRALLGISMDELTDEWVKEHKVKELKGVYITNVVKGGAADKAGVLDSDILLSINGIPVNSLSSVHAQISKYRPDDKVDITVLRGDKEMTLSAVLQNRPENVNTFSSIDEVFSHLLGAKLQPAGVELKRKLGIRSGVEVLVVSDGRLKTAGVEKGFVITHVNQMAVGTVKELENVIEKSSRRSALIEGKYPDGTTAYYALSL